MLDLIIAPAGAGKTHWLQLQTAAVRISCTNLAHRDILTRIADALGITYQSRATIDDLTQAITDISPATIALDDVDRVGAKLCYSILALSTHHRIIATATVARRVTIITERNAATLGKLPAVPIAAIVREHYPSLTPAQLRRISSIATTPAHAVRLAQAIADGHADPTPTPQSNTWLLLMLGIAIIAYIRYTNTDMSPVTIALITGAGYVLRRMLWRSL